MELSSYDELLQQVESLKAENCTLRKELADNSNHLNKLENEASTMKEVLSHLQGTMDGRPDSLMTENDCEGVLDNREINSHSTCSSELENVSNSNWQTQLLQLERERARIVQDIDAEEKEKQWYLAGLERINHQLIELSNANGFTAHKDIVLQKQLEQDADALQESMQQKLGTRGEMQRREEARFHSICLIDKEIEKLFPEEHRESLSKFFNGHLVKDRTGAYSDLQNDFPKLKNLDAELSSKMTTSGTQTVGRFSTESLSPPPPPGGDLGNLSSIYHGTWPVDKVLWHSGPSSLGGNNSIHSFHAQDSGSVTSCKSSVVPSYRTRSNNQQLGTKVEMVYSLLSMLGSHDKDDMSRKLLNMSSSVDSCIAMRQSGCLPLLIELLHGDDKDGVTEKRRPSRDTRRRASQALHNIVHSHPDDKRGRREARVLRLLEQIREYCNSLRDSDSGSDEEQPSPDGANADQHPVPAMAMVMKLSFDEEHRHAMCQLGGLQTIAELVQIDYENHGNMNDQYCITLRRYAGMALTNLTFGDGTNKALLCSLRSFMRALVSQLHSPSEDLRQVIASVLRNLSWRADPASKKTLREVGTVATLMKASMEAKKESTMKSILSALWNLSAHCSINKADICDVDGALAFLVGTLTYKSPSKTHAIIENGGGILRNISSHIAVREEYRATLRKHNCLQILLQHLRSPSLTIVSNACGTLWNLSARCTEDQETLWDMGAVGMLRNLVNSKHKMISMGSSAALKNLLAAKPGGLAATTDKNKSGAPSLLVRKQKFLEAELDQSLSETCENLDSPKTSPTHHRSDGEPKYGTPKNNQNQAAQKDYNPTLGPYQLHGRMYHSVGGQLPPKHISRSESKESIVSTQSDSSHDRLRNLNILLHNRQAQVQENADPTSPSPALSAPAGVLESRIQYVMQEVTRQIALEKNEMIQSDCASRISYLKSASSKSSPDATLSIKTPKFVRSTNNNSETINQISRNAILDKYTNLTSMIENLSLDDGENSDQPVNYSLKYSEEADRCLENKLLEADSETRLTPKVDNCTSVEQNKDLNRNALKPNYVKSAVQTNIAWQESLSKQQPAFKLNSNQSMYSHYAETDLDDPDQPTNYSLLYTEDTDTTDNFCPPAPQDERPYFTQEYTAKGPSMHDDTLMTYCTEDTPLNFSTATSLTDLREIKGEINLDVDDLNEEKCSEVDQKESNCNEEFLDKNNDSKVSESCSLLAEKGSDAGENNESQLNSSPDKAVSYCVEGTPVCFSRVSSLSSIHSNDDDDDPQPLPQSEDAEQSLLQRNVGSSVVGSEEHLDDKPKQQQQEVNKVTNFEQDFEAESEVDKTRPIMVMGKADVKSTTNNNEGKTVTFGEDHYAEETPLMFSRCSSLGSLSSFDQHSIHDDHSSVISDFSRRASEVVSPSDLPDSPGQTRPSSPRFSQAQLLFPTKNHVNDTAKPRNVQTPPLPEAKRVPSTKSCINIFEDSPHVFAEEGTPLQFSQATSLSSLALCYEASEDNEESPKQDRADLGSCGSHEDKQSSPDFSDSAEYQVADKCSPDGESQDHANDENSANLSEGEDNEEDLLVACINSAMPNNTRHGKHKHNNTKLYSRINVLSGSNARMMRGTGSGIPVKASNLKVGYGGISLHPSSGTSMSGCAGAAMAPSKALNKPSLPCSQDPASSDQMSKYSCKTDSSNGRDSNSDTSSVFDDDNDNILAQCIQSGMPKASPSACNNVSNAKHAGNLLNQQAETADKQGYHKTHFCHAYSGSSSKVTKQNLPYRHHTVSCNGDAVTTYAVEGTPANFSTATSLSDLTIDSVSDTPADDHHSDWSTNKHLPRSRFVTGSEMKFNDLSTSKNLQSSYSTEITKVNKTCDGEVSNKVNASSNHSEIKHYNIPLEKSSKISNNSTTEHSKRSCLEDATKSYAVENTPLCLSHGSSLSSLSGFTPAEDAERSNVEFQHEQHMKFEVEDTPVCFSRNSSLSSLSIESLGVETTPLEQALLDECISSGMPKGRLTDGSTERKSVRPRGSKLPCAVGSKERHSIHSRTTHKMDSILESGQSDVESRMRSNDQENVHEQNFSEPKNSEDAAVAVNTNSTAAEDTMKEDITTRGVESETSAIKNFSKFDLDIKQTYPIEEAMNVLRQVYCENEKTKQVNNENAHLTEPPHTDESSPLSQSEEIIGGALIQFEATKLAAVVQNEATKSPEEMEQSLVSQSSELVDNVNPPSLMAEVLSDSMQSSGPSDSLGTHDRRGSVDAKRIGPALDQVQSGKGHFPSRSRNVPELVMRALADINAAPKPPSINGSLENLSMRSSVVGDFIDNVKPPSLLEDADMASSTYSVCSIVSEVADSKSDNLSADYSLGSDVFRCLKPVVAMAELYARDGSMAASRHSNFSISEIIENINPPSTFLEITDTMNDCTEVGTHTLENNNDTDIEDDLPSDPEPFKIRGKFNSGYHNGHEIASQQMRTFTSQQEQQAFYNKINATEDNGDSVDDQRISGDGELDITPEEVLVLREDANLVLSTLNEIQFNDIVGEESLMEDMLIEYETLSLVSNESDSSRSTSETRDTSGTPQGSPIINRGARIVKPLNRDAVRQHASPKEEEKNGPKPIRGRRRALYPRQQVITSFTNTRFSSPKPKEMAVKPTRTSALRATQSQQKVMSGGRVQTENGGNCSPVQRRLLQRNGSPLGSSGEIKVVRPAGKGAPMGNATDEVRPKPPIKQGTFTKDKPSQRCPPKISPTKTRIPILGGISPVDGQKPSSQGNDERPPRGTSAHLPTRNRSKLGPSKSLDDGSDSSPCSAKTTGKLLTVGVSDIEKSKTWSRRGQSSSPILRSQCGASTTIIKTTAIRNSPSSHSLGGSKKSANLVKKVSGLSGSFTGARRSSSNASLCSNSSSSTTNSRKSSGGSSAKKETQSKIASIWKSRPKKTCAANETAQSTPREGMSRSSTYETISSFSSPNLPRHDIEADGSKAQAGKNAEASSEGLDGQAEHKMSKEKVKTLAEARLRKWEARKARQMARKNDEAQLDLLGQEEFSRASTSSSGTEPPLLESSTSSMESEGLRCPRLGDGQKVSNGFKGDHPSENEDDTKFQAPTNNNNNPVEMKGPTSAIVSPFNYTPSNHISGAALRAGGKAHSRSLIPTLNHVVVAPSLRQREAYVHTVEGDNIVDPKHPCMVTTV